MSWRAARAESWLVERVGFLFSFFFEKLWEAKLVDVGCASSVAVCSVFHSDPCCWVFAHFFFFANSPPTYPLIYKTLRLDENLTVRGEGY